MKTFILILIVAIATATADSGSNATSANATRAQPPKTGFTLTPQTQKRWDDLRLWVTSNGGIIHPAIDLAFFPAIGLGLKVSSRVGKNETLISIPEKLILSGNRVLEARPEFASLLKGQGRTVPGFGDDTLIGLFVAVQRYYGGSIPDAKDSLASSWETYISSLPEVCTNGELFPTDMLKKELKGTTIARRIVTVQQRRRLQYKRVKTLAETLIANEQTKALGEALSKLTFQQFQWGICSKQTRAFVVSRSTGERHSGMVPILDLCNHAHISTASYKFNENVNQFVIKAKELHKKGQQILINYGRLSNANLFMVFGFVVENNHEFDSVPLSLWSFFSAKDDRQTVKTKHSLVRLLSGSARPSIALTRDGFSQKDMSLLRIASLPAEELTSFHVSSALWKNQSQPVSENSEVIMVQSLVQEILRMMDSYTTDIAQDEDIINRLETKTKRFPLTFVERMRLMAVHYRAEEKITLLSCLEALGFINFDDLSDIQDAVGPEEGVIPNPDSLKGPPVLPANSD